MLIESVSSVNVVWRVVAAGPIARLLVRSTLLHGPHQPAPVVCAPDEASHSVCAFLCCVCVCVCVPHTCVRACVSGMCVCVCVYIPRGYSLSVMDFARVTDPWPACRVHRCACGLRTLGSSCNPSTFAGRRPLMSGVWHWRGPVGRCLPSSPRPKSSSTRWI